MKTAILWFRQDLRLSDHGAIAHAIQHGYQLIPVFIWDPAREGAWAAGGATRWWLHHALASLNKKISGAELWIGQGESAELLKDLVTRTGAEAVFWSRRYEPEAIVRDTELKTLIGQWGVEARSFNNALLFEPHTVSTGQGRPYQVFTPFWRQVSSGKISRPHRYDQYEVSWLSAPDDGSTQLDELALLPNINWDAGFHDRWEVSEEAAQGELQRFLDSGIRNYGERRDYPFERGTSRMSPYLHFGMISPRQVWEAADAVCHDRGISDETYLKEIVWREFAHHILYHFPHTPEAPLRDKYADFPWNEDVASLRAWKRGITGYPIVDAGMRELWSTGWMHNRVRMIVASFLVKHLLISWQEGARWFWDTLVDADLASNTLGWQWAGGCGADAAPYFRIFNPMTQGAKFDAAGDYVRRWVPELANLSTPYIHQPWEAPASALKDAGVILGETYPHPIVDHKASRNRALEALDAIK